jgi:hypothetical protein
VTTQDADPAGVAWDTLRTTISEFRDQLDGLFEEQRAWLLSQDGGPGDETADPAPTPIPTPTPTPATPPAPVPTRRHSPRADPVAEEPPPAAPPAMPRPWLQGDLPAPTPTQTPRPASPAPADDPRQRLDALARMLHSRLKPPAAGPKEDDG